MGERRIVRLPAVPQDPKANSRMILIKEARGLERTDRVEPRPVVLTALGQAADN